MMFLLDTDGDGVIDVHVPVPNAPVVLGFDSYDQFVGIDGTANPLGVVTTNAGHGIVGYSIAG